MGRDYLDDTAKETDVNRLSSIIVFAVASSGSGVGAQDAPSQARVDLAPTGKLRRHSL